MNKVKHAVIMRSRCRHSMNVQVSQVEQCHKMYHYWYYSRFLNDKWVIPTLVYVVIWLYLDSSIPSQFAELTSAHSSVSTSLAVC